jgi:hypothetical protein
LSETAVPASTDSERLEAAAVEAVGTEVAAELAAITA